MALNKMTIFNQPHIFIVYPPGAGGNFISNICSSIQNQQLNNIEFPVSGSSHVNQDRKMLGTDFLCFGTLPNDTYQNHHDEKRINYYLDKIKLSYDNKPYVTWTHDFSNIPVYKKYFPNAKIIAVTQRSNEEKLTILFMRLLKTHMSDDANKPFSDEESLRFMFIWKLMVKRCLIGLDVPIKLVNDIIDDIRRPEYFDIVNYASIQAYLHYYGIAGIVDQQYGSDGIDVTNKMFYPVESSKKFVDANYKKSVSSLEFKNIKKSWNNFPREIKNDIDEYLTEDVVVMPYKIIIDENVEEFVAVINRVFNNNLNPASTKYINDLFKKYLKSQNQIILKNPKKYYADSQKKYQRSLLSLLQDNNI